MAATARVAPVEISIKFGDGDYLFRMRSRHIAALQEKRGYNVTWQDGSTGRRPKPLGAIWREHTSGEYDPLDSEEIILQGLIGGAQGVVNDIIVAVTPVSAKMLTERHFDDMPQEDKWQLALAILIACCQGYVPPKKLDDPDPDDEVDTQGNVDGVRMTDLSTSPKSSATETPAASGSKKAKT